MTVVEFFWIELPDRDGHLEYTVNYSLIITLIYLNYCILLHVLLHDFRMKHWLLNKIWNCINNSQLITVINLNLQRYILNTAKCRIRNVRFKMAQGILSWKKKPCITLTLWFPKESTTISQVRPWISPFHQFQRSRYDYSKTPHYLQKLNSHTIFRSSILTWRHVACACIHEIFNKWNKIAHIENVHLPKYTRAYK